MQKPNENLCVVFLDPKGDQESYLNDLHEGLSREGWYAYLVHANRDNIPFDIEDLGDPFHDRVHELGGEWPSGEEYCEAFEKRLDEAGIKYERMPDKCFEIFSMLY